MWERVQSTARARHQSTTHNGDFVLDKVGTELRCPNRMTESVCPWFVLDLVNSSGNLCFQNAPDPFWDSSLLVCPSAPSFKISRDKNLSTKLTELKACATECFVRPVLLTIEPERDWTPAITVWLGVPLESYWGCCYSCAFAVTWSYWGCAPIFLCCAYFWRVPWFSPGFSVLKGAAFCKYWACETFSTA
jgi:hypothetical protein